LDLFIYFDTKYSKTVMFLTIITIVHAFKIFLIYSCDGKGEFSAAITPELFLICWFGNFYYYYSMLKTFVLV